ncbi:MAG: tripartite tricarboxylate transporter substrate binding protein [Hyphomicrobiales bacterium]|nr:tripartite tricarboxylate transporter substrate binding protein [Alphaproteobacteria bacterium]
MTRGPARRLAGLCFLVVALLFTTPPAHAQSDYPNKPVRIVVGFTPGSVADITARVLGSRMGQILGQSVVVENKPGAGSNLAAEFVARSPKDGYTLFLPGSANIANAAINPSLPFDIIKDFAPIGLVNAVSVILVVHPSLGVNNVQELIAYAKSKPGELSYASTGIGSAPHFSGELFMQRTGTKLVHVPYPGSPQAATDLLAARVQVMFSPATAVISLVQGGKLKVLASSGAKRPGILPDVPTMIESGMPDFDTAIWFGLSAPVGTPREAIDKLSRAVREAVKSSEVVTAWRPQGVDPLDGGPDDMVRLETTELKRWSDVATAAGLKK